MTDPADIGREARLSAIALIRGALDDDTEALKTFAPPDARNHVDTLTYALTTVAAEAVMEAAASQGITPAEWLDKTTRDTIMRDPDQPDGH